MSLPAEEINPYRRRIREHPGVLKNAQDLPLDFYTAPKRIIDLGCGLGHFLAGVLRTNPQWRGLGIEQRFKRVCKTADKIGSLGSFSIRQDALEFLGHQSHSFWDEVWIQFPDPWPKKRQSKHRMIKARLFQEIHRVLRPGGRFCFISDTSSYWHFLIEQNRRTKLFPISRFSRSDLFSEYPTTSFKKVFLSQNQPLYSAEFRKISFS